MQRPYSYSLDDDMDFYPCDSDEKELPPSPLVPEDSLPQIFGNYSSDIDDE